MIRTLYRDREVHLADAKRQIELARALLGRRRYILMFSHMRSYSSLIGHILGSNPDISGYAELQRGYQSAADLLDLRYQVWKINGMQLRGKYVFDKILHGKFRVADEVLLRRDVVPIYALREPFASVRSIVAMGRRSNKETWQQDPHNAASHVVNRYSHLCDLAERRRAAAVIHTDSVVRQPVPTLQALTEYLHLSRPLTTSYRRFEKTGAGRWGDPMGPIAAGRLVANRPVHPEVELDGPQRRKLVDAYVEAAGKLAICDVVIGAPFEVRTSDERGPGDDEDRQ
jgi:hypothetical protein